MFCIKCGTELPDDANFCLVCGKSQKADLPVDEPIWETCEIVYGQAEKGSFLKWPKYYFWAKAIGPNGSYCASKSEIFDSNGPPPPDGDYFREIADDRLEFVTSELVKDGWEFIGTFGLFYWQKRFRRRVKN